MDFYDTPPGQELDKNMQPAHPQTHIDVDDSFAVMARKNIDAFKERMT
jgi:hypothetical protein